MVSMLFAASNDSLTRLRCLKREDGFKEQVKAPDPDFGSLRRL